jgi:hypothetical protein
MMVRKYLFWLGLLFLMSVAVRADTSADVMQGQRAIQDPKTKVIYYLESDLRHIVALSVDGKLLWCCDAVPARSPARAHVLEFALPKSDAAAIGVSEVLYGPAWGEIDRKTGTYLFKGED